MAEAIFNRFNKDTESSAASAGIAIAPHSLISKNAVSALKHYVGVDISGRAAIQLYSHTLEASDLILTMTKGIKGIIIDKYPTYSDKVFTLNEYVGKNGDIIDPYGGNESIYKDTYKLLKESIELLLDKLQER